MGHTSTFGPLLGIPTIVTARSGTSQPEYNRFFTAGASRHSGSLYHAVQRTAAYDAPGASIPLRVPDFSGVAGFDAASRQGKITS